MMKHKRRSLFFLYFRVLVFHKGKQPFKLSFSSAILLELEALVASERCIRVYGSARSGSHSFQK